MSSSPLSHSSRGRMQSARRTFIVMVSWTAAIFLLFVPDLSCSAGMGMAAALVPSPRHIFERRHYITSNGKYSSTTQFYATQKHSPLEDEPWQKDDSYWDQLQVASKDPEAFEKFIEESMARKKGGTSVMKSSSTNGVNGSADANGETKPKKGKYVPIEEWEASRQNGENMSKEERLQWECQRSGNQFKQNEILRHHLNSF